MEKFERGQGRESACNLRTGRLDSCLQCLQNPILATPNSIQFTLNHLVPLGKRTWYTPLLFSHLGSFERVGTERWTTVGQSFDCRQLFIRRGTENDTVLSQSKKTRTVRRDSS